MGYRVEISRRAEADLEQLYLWVVERAPQQGADGSTDSNAPFSHSTIIRSAVLSRPKTWTPNPVRVMRYGRKPNAYRVFFTIDEDDGVVRVLHVRRGARQWPMADELTYD